jgi:hypothetical protein
MGDAYGAAIIEHLSRDELALLPAETEIDPESPPEIDYHESHKGNGSVMVEGTKL